MPKAATSVWILGRGNGTTAGQIDKVCVDWLKKNYGEEFATQYGPYSLLIPMWNTIEFNEALGTLMQVLRIAFGPDESFGTIGYYESRRKLKLSDDRTPIPGVFLKALVESCERG